MEKSYITLYFVHDLCFTPRKDKNAMVIYGTAIVYLVPTGYHCINCRFNFCSNFLIEDWSLQWKLMKNNNNQVLIYYYLYTKNTYIMYSLTLA